MNEAIEACDNSSLEVHNRVVSDLKLGNRFKNLLTKVEVIFSNLFETSYEMEFGFSLNFLVGSSTSTFSVVFSLISASIGSSTPLYRRYWHKN